jgi:adenosylcobalamin-dependent ribonucleoside-triphosphate reductase
MSQQQAVKDFFAQNSEKYFQVPKGMPLAIWENKYARKKEDGTFQSWPERLEEVVVGNFSLVDNFSQSDFDETMELSKRGIMVYAGRHLQQGDKDQRNKNLELFSNCSTACFSYLTFLLLLNGSGVGSDYSNVVRRINWDFMPNVRIVLNCGENDQYEEWDGAHPDAKRARNEFAGQFETLREAKHKYPSESEAVRWFKVEDSREGWVKVIEILETAAYQQKHKDKLFIFDFSGIRCEGTPIAGHQNRPASGPLPFMRAISKVISIKGAGMAPWKQAIFIDHYLADCVAIGGVRRSARIATKSWRDNDILDFIELKRGGHLGSANNSITVDKEFWVDVGDPRTHAYRVFQAATAASYYDRTGEPGFINADMLHQNNEGMDNITGENIVNPEYSKYKVHVRTKEMMTNILSHIKNMKNSYICNPCGEIAIKIYGGYCVIGDVNLAKVENLEEAEKAVEMMAKFLMRVNTMESIYKNETVRTNRIGVGMIGIFEFAAKHFDLNFKKLISAYDPISTVKNILDSEVDRFWKFMSRLRFIVENSAKSYAQELEVNVPHTMTTLKPAGTVAKVLAVTEAANLPAYLYYLRWVQFPKEVIVDGQSVEDLEVKKYRESGYPVKDVSHQYQNRVVVGFPTKQNIVDQLGEADITTASEVSIEDHYKWLQLLEYFWLGFDENGKSLNNQISYTAKFLHDTTSYEEFMLKIKENQSKIRCCSFDVSQSTESLISAYAYVPEEPITKDKYVELISSIQALEKEAYDDDSLQCASGICPIELDNVA